MDDSLAPTEDPRDIEARLAMPLAEAMLTQRAVAASASTSRRPDSAALSGVGAGSADIFERPELGVRGCEGPRRQGVAGSAIPDALWRLYTGFGRPAKADEQTAKILKSVRWQVEHFEEIPVLVVCCLRGGARVPFVPSPPFAASSHYGSVYPSVQNLLLAARSVGLGGALITMPLWSNTVARRILKLPLSVEPCCIVTLGWPKGHYGRKPRKAIGTVAHLDQYGRQPWHNEPPAESLTH